MLGQSLLLPAPLLGKVCGEYDLQIDFENVIWRLPGQMWPIGLQENNNTFRVSSVLSHLAARKNHKLLEAASSKRVQESKNNY